MYNTKSGRMRLKMLKLAVLLPLVLCLNATAKTPTIDEIWAATPPTNDGLWAHQNQKPMNSDISSPGTRVQLWSGSSTSASMSIPSNITTIYTTFDLDGRGVTQVMFDLQEAAARGDVRVYNRGGENADRPYDALIKVSKLGNSLTLRGEGIWTGAPVIKKVIGYSQ